MTFDAFMYEHPVIMLLYSRCWFFARLSFCITRRDYGLNTQGAKFRRRIYKYYSHIVPLAG